MMNQICENCLKPSKDKPQFKAYAKKGGAKLPAEGYVCSACLQKMIKKELTVCASKCENVTRT